MSRRRKQRSAPKPAIAPGRLYVGLLVLCGIGALLSLYLLQVHVKVHTDPTYHSACSFSEGLDCEAVAASDYSLFGELPLAIWGLLGYVALAAWAMWGSRRAGGAAATSPWGMLFAACLCFTAIALRMAYVSHFIIQSLCVVCAGLYVINIALLIVTVLELRRRKARALQAVREETGSMLKRPALPLLFLTALLGGVMILKASITPYWTINFDGPGGLPVGETAEGLPWIGAAAPDVEIVEYSDYQCPHCVRGHDAMRDLVKANPDRVRLIHRHYPLDQACNPKITRPFHAFACSYARLAWCAGRQGRFWEANDYIFQMGKRKDRVTPAELARQLGLDADDITACEKGREAAREVDRDLKAGRKLGFSGTPTFVMNGKVYTGGIPAEAIAAALGTSGTASE